MRRLRALSQTLGVPITAWSPSAGYDGRNWLEPRPGAGASVETIWVDGGDPGRALAALAIALETPGKRQTPGVPLRDASPAVFVDRDGAPIGLDADRGLLRDAMTDALATGLGRVEWPTGLAAPLESPPRVVAPAKEVTRATLAPGYIPATASASACNRNRDLGQAVGSAGFVALRPESSCSMARS